MGAVYKNPYLGAVIEVLEYLPDYGIMEIRYIEYEFMPYVPQKDTFHLSSPFVKGLVELKYWDTPLYKKLEGI